METENTVRMKVHWVWQGIYGFMFLVSFVLSLLLLSRGFRFGVLLLVFSMLVGFFLKMSFLYLEADREKIFVFTPPFGKYTIRWDEIKSAETNGIGYVLFGDDKTLGFNTAMGNGDAVKFREFVDKMLLRMGIEIRQVNYVPRSRPRNTRVG